MRDGKCSFWCLFCDIAKLVRLLQVVKSNQLTPILQCHGDADPLVTYEFGKMASQMIGTFNSCLQFKSYPGLVHSYCYLVLSFFSISCLCISKLQKYFVIAIIDDCY